MFKQHLILSAQDLFQLQVLLLSLALHMPLFSPPRAPHHIDPQNTHSVRTRGKHGIVQLRLHPSLLLAHVEPNSYRHFLQDPKRHSEIQEEYNAVTQSFF